MTRRPVSVPAGAPFATVAAILARRRIGAVPVLDRHGQLIGVVSAADLMGVRDGVGVTARELMTESVRTVSVDATVPVATRLLAESGVRRLFVTEHGRLMGVLSRRDLLSVYVRDDDDIRMDVEHVVAEVPGGRPVRVSVRDGVALLLGRVEWRSTRAAIAERARAVPGVVEVLDRLGYVFDDGARLTGAAR
ncbi:CBS domain-containing protein [Actinophytocola sp. NPDC049390]|uniref:CBS domain-containing protein n=1 Tax=Actinophytocola sp. NPDC049390 TaxID=3363894 RepID=UPI0037A3EA90